tara:strand:- start:277 stop:915 length:639 start_codon:yes stop_codon:yes gene_type:complete
MLEVLAKDASKELHRVAAGISSDQRDYLDDIESSGPEYESQAGELAQTLGSKEGVYIKGKEGKNFLKRKAIEDSANQVINRLKNHPWQKIRDNFKVTKGEMDYSGLGKIPKIIIGFYVSKGQHAFDIVVKAVPFSSRGDKSMSLNIMLIPKTKNFEPTDQSQSVISPGRWSPTTDYGVDDFYKDAGEKLDSEKLDQLVKDMEAGIARGIGKK